MSTNSRGGLHTPFKANPCTRRDNASTYCAARLNFDIPDSLLAEVDFKWLMAGQGYRVDPKRFSTDRAYTMDLLHEAQRSESLTVRECRLFTREN